MRRKKEAAAVGRGHVAQVDPQCRDLLGRWAEQTVRGAFPNVPPHGQADRARKLRELTELHERGVITDAEFQELRVGLK